VANVTKIFFGETPVPRPRNICENRCSMFVKGATNDKQGRCTLRGKRHSNRGPGSKNYLVILSYDLGLFFLCKQLILWYKSRNENWEKILP